MNRRNFINKGAQLTAASLVPSVVSALPTPKTDKPTKPSFIAKRLEKGATVGLIAPGYALTKTALANAVSNIKAMGYKPYYTSRIEGQYGYLSNTDALRVEDIHHMFTNPDVDGIICARGGYGCTRILDQINYDLIAQNPKVLVGFSDITALANSIYKKTGLVCFHGPVATNLNNNFNRSHLSNIISKPTLNQLLTSPPSNKSDSTFDQYVIHKGTATGTIVGGNLSLLAALCGTPYDIDYTDKIVIIEDIDEDPYSVDRMLTQLRAGASFNKAKGLVLGVFKGCDEPNRTSFSLKEVVLDRLQALNIPAIYGFSFGHIDHNISIPIGVQGRLNTDNFSLELLEDAVL